MKLISGLIVLIVLSIISYLGFRMYHTYPGWNHRWLLLLPLILSASIFISLLISAVANWLLFLFERKPGIRDKTGKNNLYYDTKKL